MIINSVAILGLGAVGSYLLWGLSEKTDIELYVIAEGERKGRFYYKWEGISPNYKNTRRSKGCRPSDCNCKIQFFKTGSF